MPLVRYLRAQALSDLSRYDEAIAALRKGLPLAAAEQSAFWEAEIFFTLVHMEQFTCAWDKEALRSHGDDVAHSPPSSARASLDGSWERGGRGWSKGDQERRDKDMVTRGWQREARGRAEVRAREDTARRRGKGRED